MLRRAKVAGIDVGGSGSRVVARRCRVEEVHSSGVVVAEADSPALEEAAAPLRERSIQVSVGELSCDAGAAEALGAAPDSHAVSVMFETREAADAFAATLTPPPAGVAQVTVGCAD